MLADYESVVRNEQAWVAEGNGRIVGLLVLRFEHGFVLLDNVAVAPEVQRVGIGSALLAFAEDQGRQAGLSKVRLYTNVAMTENLSYYLHHGYRETHRAVQDGYQRVFFSKSINTRSP
jgi:ribosomal protein S18 acetylase RimI-like enzyme